MQLFFTYFKLPSYKDIIYQFKVLNDSELSKFPKKFKLIIS